MNNKTIVIFISLLVLAGLSWFAFGLYTWLSKTQISYRISPEGKVELVASSSDKQSVVSVNSLVSTILNQPVASSSIQINQITVKASGLVLPKGVAVLPDGRLIVIEKKGTVKLVGLDDKVTDILTVPDVDTAGEAGLLGLALDPNFSKNNKAYLFYTYHNQEGELFNKLVSYDLVSIIDNLTATSTATSTGPAKVFAPLVFNNDQILIDRIPAGYTDNGGTITFGPDNNLWILTGDAGKAILAQDNQSLAGKILRVTNTGQIPNDNPVKESVIYASGLRQPTGLTWSKSARLVTGFVSEAGNNGYDEVNLLSPGSNYGWPATSGCLSGDSRFRDPVICSDTKTWGPSGLVIVATKTASSSLVMSTTVGKALITFDINRNLASTSPVVDYATMLSGYGRLGGVINTGDVLYAWTSNRDSRNPFEASDDRVIRIDLK